MTKPRSMRQYPPLEVLSPDRKLRLAVGPGPAVGGWRGLFRSPPYEHQLFEADVHDYRSPRPSERRRWRLERSSACPWMGFVHDDGTCAVLHADDELIFLDDAGKLTATCNVLDVLRPELPAGRMSTAGPFWTDLPTGLFVETARGLRLSFRLARRARVCFDPATASRDRLAEKSPELLEAERPWVARSLQAALDRDDLPCAGAMAVFAGQDGLTSLIPVILSLEARADHREWHFSTWVWEGDHSATRARAQTALVRLGADFEPANAFGKLDQPRPAGWRAALERLRPGMNADEIFQAVGAPFFDGHLEGSSETIWEYDVRLAAGYQTRRLTFDGKRLKTSAWVGESFREPHRDLAR